MNLQDAVCPFIILSHLILYKTRNVSPCICRGNQNTYFMLNKPFSENCAVYEMCGKI